MAVPGDYTVSLHAAGKELSASVRIKGDPRIDVSAADYQAQLDAALVVRDLMSQVHRVIDTTASLTEQLESLEDTLEDSDREDSTVVAEAVVSALAEIEKLDNRLQRPFPAMGYRQYPRIREELRSLASYISAAASRPTEPQMVVLEELKGVTAQVVGDLKKLLSTTIRDLNQMLGSYPKIISGGSETN